MQKQAITKFSMLLQMPRHWHRPLITQTLVGLQDLDQRCDEASGFRRLNGHVSYASKFQIKTLMIW